MVSDVRKFERTELTQMIVDALFNSIHSMRELGYEVGTTQQRKKLQDAKNLYNRIVNENMDVRLASRDY